MSELYGERPGHTYDAAWWAAVHTLFDEAFPGLPDGIARAAAAGVTWAEVTTPFALFEGDRCVCHVGVLAHPVRLDGRDRVVAGIHAVCTATDHRRRGLCRRVLGAALAWADRHHDLAKLHTEAPEVYTSSGFRPTPMHRFRATAAPAPDVARRRLDPVGSAADAALLARLLAARTPASHRLATRDPGWLVTIDAALSSTLDRFWYLPDHDAVVVCWDRDDHVLIVEVIAERLPPAAVVVGAARPAGRKVWWSFCPDRLDPDARPEPAPAALGVFMTRGDWPVHEPFGVSPLWEH